MVHALTTLAPLFSGELKAAGCRELKISCGLTAFPCEIFELADTLEVLDLSGNALNALPDDLHRLHRLQILFCSNNLFTELPAVLGQCAHLEMVGFKSNRIETVPAAALPPRLRWLILSDNALRALPPEIGGCHRLQKLMLAGNQLRELPATLANCHALELLRIAANQLTHLPAWLLQMPRLSWLAYAGNPFTLKSESRARQEATHTLSVAWQSLQLQHTLGEGASGVIHQATASHPQLNDTVAVKLFKGDVTSDGSPLSEMSAWMHAKQHPHLISVLARVTDHPDGAHGLVMPLIGKHFKNLAQPPSRASCTRDVYAQGTQFEVRQALSVAAGIASAATHLHAHQLMHGDLYGHNILVDANGHAFLGDFGAASFVPSNASTDTAQAIERLEVRAFGCLLEELVAHCVASPDSDGVLQALQQLANDCMQHTPLLRPLFTHILQRLQAASAA